MNQQSLTPAHALDGNERLASLSGIALVIVLHGAVAGWILHGPRAVEHLNPVRSVVAATLLSGPGQAASVPVITSPVNPAPVRQVPLPAEPPAEPTRFADQPPLAKLPEPTPDLPTEVKTQVRQQHNHRKDESQSKNRERTTEASHVRHATAPATAPAATPDTTHAATPAAMPVAAVAQASTAGAAPTVAQNGDAAIPAASIAAGVSCQKPEYPKASRRSMEEGVVSLRFLVESDGRVLNAEIEKSSGFGRLDEAARTALALCQFRPGQVNGAPVRSWARINYSWKLQ